RSLRAKPPLELPRRQPVRCRNSDTHRDFAAFAAGSRLRTPHAGRMAWLGGRDELLTVARLSRRSGGRLALPPDPELVMSSCARPRPPRLGRAGGVGRTKVRSCVTPVAADHLLASRVRARRATRRRSGRRAIASRSARRSRRLPKPAPWRQESQVALRKGALR